MPESRVAQGEGFDDLAHIKGLLETTREARNQSRMSRMNLHRVCLICQQNQRHSKWWEEDQAWQRRENDSLR